MARLLSVITIVIGHFHLSTSFSSILTCFQKFYGVGFCCAHPSDLIFLSPAGISNLSRAFGIISLFSFMLITLCNLVCSVDFISMPLIPSSIALMKMLNKIRPSINPYGTPLNSCPKLICWDFSFKLLLFPWLVKKYLYPCWFKLFSSVIVSYTIKIQKLLHFLYSLVPELYLNVLSSLTSLLFYF